MKKVFVILTLLFCLVMVSFSLYYPKTEKVLLAAELVGFEIEEEEEETNNSDGTINTSLKQLGIVTYINPETNQFAALGHSLINSKEGTDIEGTCYTVQMDSSYANLEDGQNLGSVYLDENNPIGYVYLDENNPIGYVYYDSYSGVYGKIDNISGKQYMEVETANRYNIKTGKANILIRLDGENLESFEVEILAINYIDSNKNLRIKITDERLINETGGIVQGMSGTPVMQDGKLVGAINCVSIESAQDAFAIFIDKLL